MGFLQYIFGLRRMPFVRDVLTVQTGSIILMGAGFLSSVAFARFLGKETYGLYAVILAFAGTASAFFNIGQGQSLYIFFSEAYGKKDRSAMAAVLANFLHIASVNIALLGVLAYLMPLLSESLYHDASIGRAARILCFFQMSEIWNSMVLILLQSVRRIRLKVTLEQSANLSYLGLAIVVLALGGGIRGALLTQLGVSLFFLPVSLYFLMKLAREAGLPGVREVVRVPFRNSNQYMFQGLLITADKTIGNFFPQGLFFLFSLTSPAAFVGSARIAVQLATIPKNILLPQAGDLSTAAFGKMKAEGVQTIRTNAAKLIKHALGLHAAMTLGAMLTFPFIVFLFYGPEYWDAIPLTLWLLLISLGSGIQTATAPIIRLYRKTHYSILTAAVNWAAMITATFALAKLVSPQTSFLVVFAIAQIVPLVLPAYIFLTLLRQPKAS